MTINSRITYHASRIINPINKKEFTTMSDSKKATLRAKLEANRQELLATLQPLTDKQWNIVVFSEGEGWRVSDLLRHLVDAERSMTNLIENIRKGGEGVPADFDLQRWNSRNVGKAKEKSPDLLFGELETNRVRLLELLDSIEAEDWDKKGRHGSLRMMTVEEILNLIADHESWHGNDIRQAIQERMGL